MSSKEHDDTDVRHDDGKHERSSGTDVDEARATETRPTHQGDHAPLVARRSDAGHPVVGIGASADGLEALNAFFEALPDEPEMTFVVIQHLSPDHESSLAEILQKHTEMETFQVTDETLMRPNRVYVIPPDKKISIREGRFHLDPLPDEELKRTTIDFFLRSLGEDQLEQAVGIVLSGSGSDGAAGLQVIKQHGGLTMVQDLEEAGFQEMPRNAVNTGAADVVAPVGELAEELVDFFESKTQYGPLHTPDKLNVGERRALERILKLVRILTGNDLSEYKRPTILRRVGRRMQILRMHSLKEYHEYLQDNNEEVSKLFSELLIKVTSFFRDPDVWEAVRDELISELFSGKQADDEVRVWVPGCSSGEEAYTLGMLLREHADGMNFAPEIKIFATDIDEEAIATARKGWYPEAIAADIPADYLQRFFRPESDGYRVSKELRDQVVFAVQNVLEDPPFSYLDLISCRNLLIYLDTSAQERVLGLFNYALRPGGYLLLGNSESTSVKPDLFESFDKSKHLYRARESADPHPLIPGEGFGGGHVQLEEDEGEEVQKEKAPNFEAIHRDMLARTYAPTSLLVNDNYTLVHVFGDPIPYLKIREGHPTKDLMKMLHEDLRPSVRTMLYQLFESGGPLDRHLSFEERGERRYVQVRGHRVEGTSVDERLAEVSFEPVDREAPDVDEEEPGEEMLPIVEQLEQELEETRKRLHATIEEYETSNEELKASNEELLSMNEELQSTTEELETSKEELQSMNEELTTVNDELNQKIEELNEVNSDLKNLLRSTDIGTIFLDRDLRIKRFTDPTTEYFNLIPSDEGRPFEHITHSLELDGDLAEDARRALEDLTMIEREARSANDRYFLIRILPYRTVQDQIDGVVMSFVEITDRKRAQKQLEASERKFRTVFETAADAMFVYELDENGTPSPFVEVNGNAVRLLERERRELETWTIADLFAETDIDVETHLESIQTERRITTQTELVPGSEGSEPIPVEIHANCEQVTGDLRIVVENVRDITDRKRYEETLVEAKEKAEKLAELRSMFLSTVSHDVRSPLMAIGATIHVLEQRIDDEEALEQLERIQGAADQLRETLDSILEMARLESEESIMVGEAFDLDEKVREMAALHREWASKKGLELTCDDVGEPVEVELDPRFVARILNNLVDNAIKYTEEGHITVRLETPDGSTVRLEVEDTGRGIPDAEREAIFERFQKGASAETNGSEGVGLGLAITNLLVESLDGSIEVDSEEGVGTTFVVELPREIE